MYMQIRKTLPTENLLEDTDGLLRPPQLPPLQLTSGLSGAVAYCVRVLLTCALLMSSLHSKVLAPCCYSCSHLTVVVGRISPHWGAGEIRLSELSAAQFFVSRAFDASYLYLIVSPTHFDIDFVVGLKRSYLFTMVLIL